MTLPKRSKVAESGYLIQQLLPEDVTAAIARDMSLLTSELSEREINIDADQCRIIAEDFCVAESNSLQRLVGMACIVIMRLPQGLRLLLESVVVKSTYRKAGIGSAILDHVVTISKELGAEHINLTCRSHRSGASKLYSAHGFEVVDTSVWRRPLLTKNIKRNFPSHTASAHRHS